MSTYFDTAKNITRAAATSVKAGAGMERAKHQPLHDEIRRCRRIIRGMFGALCDQNQDMELFDVDELAKARFDPGDLDEYLNRRADASYQETIARRYLNELKARGDKWNS